MALKFKIRKWLTATEAAKFLSISTGEEFSRKDIASLVLEGTLTPYWRLYRQPARIVIPYTKLTNFFPMTEKESCDEQKGQHLKGFENNTGTSNDSHPCASMEFLVPEWLPQGFSRHGLLTGNFQIPSICTEALVSNLSACIGGEGGDLINIDGPIVVDQDGTFWNLLDYMSSNQSITQDEFYFPSSMTPVIEDLVFLRREVKALFSDDEETIPKQNPNQGGTLVNNKSKEFSATNMELSHPAIDSNHPYYAPELHAAIEAWESLYLNGEKPEHLDHTTAVIQWLTKNWPEFGKTAKQRLAMVTNTKDNKNSGRFQEKQR